jgi:putative restriction endonuclease
MRISRRTSGGRGEYEISDEIEDIGPRDLQNSRLVAYLGGDIRFDTGTNVVEQGGKMRLRLAGKGIQAHRQVAAALLMPKPVRKREGAGSGRPILKTGEYSVEAIEFGTLQLQPGEAAFGIREIVLGNFDHAAEELGYAERLANLEHIWAHTGELPGDIGSLLNEHRRYVRAGRPLRQRVEQIVREIQKRLTTAAMDLGIVYRTEVMDPLPDLLIALDFLRVPTPPPISIDEIPPEDIEIRRRVVCDLRRWAAVRGAASQRFRQDVQEAYSRTCVICGVHFPATSVNRIPGVDAAHILPWATYDMDHVSNGLCLCRQHHWAFDQGLIVIRHDDERYYVEVPAAVRKQVAATRFSLNELLRFEGPINDERLPHDPRSRPNPDFLAKLYEALGQD